MRIMYFSDKLRLVVWLDDDWNEIIEEIDTSNINRKWLIITWELEKIKDSLISILTQEAEKSDNLNKLKEILLNNKYLLKEKIESILKNSLSQAWLSKWEIDKIVWETNDNINESVLIMLKIIEDVIESPLIKSFSEKMVQIEKQLMNMENRQNNLAEFWFLLTIIQHHFQEIVNTLETKNDDDSSEKLQEIYWYIILNSLVLLKQELDKDIHDNYCSELDCRESCPRIDFMWLVLWTNIDAIFRWWAINFYRVIWSSENIINLKIKEQIEESIDYIVNNPTEMIYRCPSKTSEWWVDLIFVFKDIWGNPIWFLLIDSFDEEWEMTSKDVERQCYILYRELNKILDAIERYNLRKQIEESYKDALTWLWNRKALLWLFQELTIRTDRWHLQESSILLMDIDDFKSVNDKYWHDIWDAVIKMIAKLILKTKRSLDYWIRLWGEEFVMLLEWTWLRWAITKAWKLWKDIWELTFDRWDWTRESRTLSIWVTNIYRSEVKLCNTVITFFRNEIDKYIKENSTNWNFELYIENLINCLIDKLEDLNFITDILVNVLHLTDGQTVTVEDENHLKSLINAKESDIEDMERKNINRDVIDKEREYLDWLKELAWKRSNSEIIPNKTEILDSRKIRNQVIEEISSFLRKLSIENFKYTDKIKQEINRIIHEIFLNNIIKRADEAMYYVKEHWKNNNKAFERITKQEKRKLDKIREEKKKELRW